MNPLSYYEQGYSIFPRYIQYSPQRKWCTAKQEYMTNKEYAHRNKMIIKGYLL